MDLSVVLTSATVAAVVSGLFTVISQFFERRARQRELWLEKRFEALRQIKSTLDGIPRDLTVDELATRLKTEPQLLKDLKHRPVRLFGLRNELVPYLDDRIASYIDHSLRCIYHTEAGAFELKAGMEEAFARCCIELIQASDRVEKELVAQRRKLS
jgi:hypothetical protein